METPEDGDELLDPYYWMNAPPDHYNALWPGMDFERLQVAKAFGEAAEQANEVRQKRQAELDAYLEGRRNGRHGAGQEG